MNLFELAAKITLDSSEYERGLSKAASMAQNIGSKIGGAVSTIAKINTAAIGAAATGVAALTKAAVSGYGEMEQLRSGAEKIFSGMDFSKITKDANEAFRELGMSATEYFASVNQAGATFAQTMGAEEGYNMARKGMIAISDYATGTGKSISELTAKFQMITRASSSYQSIADQFAGILPQTSADFLEQAQAAGLLSTGYKKLTEVPVAEYQKAVTAMLEQGVAALNLTGNTAMEAGETITGSIGQLRAAWSNLVTGFADPRADLGQLIGNVTKAFTATVKNIVPTINRALKGISQGVKQIVPIITKELPGLVNSILPDLLDAAGGLVDGLVAALPDFVGVIAGEIPGAMTKLSGTFATGFPKIIDSLFGTFANNQGAITQGLSTVMQSIGTGLVSASGSLATYGPQILQGLFTGLSADGGGLLETAGQILNNLAAGLVKSVDVAARNAPTLINDLLTAIAGNGNNNFVNAATSIITGLARGLGEAAKTALPSLAGVVTAITTNLANNTKELTQGAVDLLDGLATGLMNSAETIVQAAPSIIEALLNGLADGIPYMVGVLLGKFAKAVEDIARFIYKGGLGDFVYNLFNGGDTGLNKFFNDLGGNLQAGFEKGSGYDHSKYGGSSLHIGGAGGQGGSFGKEGRTANSFGQNSETVQQNTQEVEKNTEAHVNFTKAQRDANQALTDADKNYGSYTQTITKSASAYDGVKTAATTAATAIEGAGGKFGDFGNKVSQSSSQVSSVGSTATEASRKIGEFGGKVSETTTQVNTASASLQQSAQNLQTMGDAAGNAVTGFDAIAIGLQNLKTEINSVPQSFGAMWSFVRGIFVNAPAFFSNVGTQSAQQFVAPWNNVPGQLQNVWNNIKGIFNKTGEAYVWGYDLSRNYADGINSGFSLITSAVDRITTYIANNLKHSTPKEGPLAGDDKWAVDMMDNWINGISGKENELHNQVKSTFDLRDYMQFSPASMTASAMNNTNAILSAIHELTDALRSQTIEMDGEKVADLIDARLGTSTMMKARV